jgi:hypothetical protein
MMSQREGLALLYGQNAQFLADAATNFQVLSICGTRGAKAADLGESGVKIFARELKKHVELRPIQPADEECVCSLSVRSKYATRGTTEWQRADGIGAAYGMLGELFGNDTVNSALAVDNREQWSRA